MKDVSRKIATSMTVEEYIQFELSSERRHEFVNGQLIEMPGEKAINNKIAGRIYIFLMNQLLSKGYEVFNHDVKIASDDRTKYFYPDVFITKEKESESNQYIKYEPELIVEVISPSTHITDTIDKYIAYTSIRSLKYYILVVPETILVTVYFKNEDGEWSAEKYLNKAEIINLPLLELNLPLESIYS